MWLPLGYPLLGTWLPTQARALTGNQTGDPLVHRLALNPLRHTSQGLIFIFLLLILEREEGEERERNIDLLFHLFMHLLGASCMCPDW